MKIFCPVSQYWFLIVAQREEIDRMPMGTIVTVCMLIGLLFAVPYAASSKLKPLPNMLAWLVGAVVFTAGGWNTFWHGLRNITNFWGLAALISGVFMMLTAVYILQLKSVPAGLRRARPFVLLGLLVCFVLYATTIARL